MPKKHYYAFKKEEECIRRSLNTEVFVSYPTALNSNNFTKKNPIKVNALWDTGATISAITQRLVKAMDLKQTGVIGIGTAGGDIICPTYYIDLYLPNNIIIRNLVVTGNDELTSCDMLIGMDVICMGDFAISNAQGKTRFSFCIPPHEKPICLYEKSCRVNKNH